MKVILVMVMSVDGKTTKWGNSNIYEWTSEEDQKFFFSLIEKNNLIIMGRRTFDAARSVMKLSPKRQRVVLTKSPEKYKEFAVTGQLEFTSDSPKELIKRFTQRGYTKVLVVGGEVINALFLKAKLVDEAWLSVEPFIFGRGNGLVENVRLDVRMELMSMERLNEQGTVLLKYKVL